MNKLLPLLVLVACVATTLGAQNEYEAAVMADNPTAYFQLRDAPASATQTNEVTTRHLNRVGTFTPQSFTRSDLAFTSSISQYLTAAPHSDFSPPAGVDFSLEIFTYASSSGSYYRSPVTNRQETVGSGGGPYAGYNLYIGPGNDYELWYGNGGWRVLNGVSALFDQWVHLAFSHDASQNKAYFFVNGVEKGTLSSALVQRTTSNPLYVGVGDGPNYAWVGSLSDLAMFHSFIPGSTWLSRLTLNPQVPAPTPQPQTNVALGKPATQSSTMGGAVAARAVDGNSNTLWWQNSCTHTNDASNPDFEPWLRVDFEARYALSTVKLWNRGDCCADRLWGISIYVGDDASSFHNNAACVTKVDVPQTSAGFSVVCSGEGRYLWVAHPGKSIALTICELEAYGVPALQQCPQVPTPIDTAAGIRFVDYNCGGQNVGYYDTSLGNAGGFGMRNDDVDIFDSGSGAPAVAYIDTNEWMEYTVSIPATGNYNMFVEWASASASQGGTLEVSLGGVSLGSIVLGSTGGWSTFQYEQKHTVALSATASAVLRVQSGHHYPFNLRTMRFEPLPTPSPPTPPPAHCDALLPPDQVYYKSGSLYSHRTTPAFHGQGLNGRKHSTNAADAWFDDKTEPYDWRSSSYWIYRNTDRYIEVEFARLVNLRRLRIWNYNAKPDLGVFEINVFTRASWSSSWLSSWSNRKTMYVKKAPGSDSVDYGEDFAYSHDGVRYLRLKVESTHTGDVYHTGISEIQFIIEDNTNCIEDLPTHETQVCEGSCMVGCAVGETKELEVTGRKKHSVDGSSVKRGGFMSISFAHPYLMWAKEEPAAAAVHNGLLGVGETAKLQLSCVECDDRIAYGMGHGIITTWPWSTHGENCVKFEYAECAEAVCRCKDGHHKVNDRCAPCPVGYYGNDGVNCHACPAGESSIQGATGCYRCGSGSYNPSPGSTCKSCPAGQDANQQRTACNSCAARGTEWYNPTRGTPCTVCQCEPHGGSRVIWDTTHNGRVTGLCDSFDKGTLCTKKDVTRHVSTTSCRCEYRSPSRGISWSDIASLFGFPHFVTPDGVAFDATFVGEAIFWECGTTRAVVREQQPSPDALYTSITGVGLMDGADKCTIERVALGSTAVAITCNGATVSAPTTAGSIQVGDNGNNEYTLLTAIGGVKVIVFANSMGVIANLTTPVTCSLTGLTGNMNDDPSDDLKARGTGTIVPHTSAMSVINDDFVSTWLITNSLESPFTAFTPANLSFVPLYSDNANNTANCPQFCGGILSCCLDANVAGNDLALETLSMYQKVYTLYNNLPGPEYAHCADISDKCVELHSECQAMGCPSCAGVSEACLASHEQCERMVSECNDALLTCSVA